MQTPRNSSSVAGGHGGGDRVGKRGRDGDEDPPNDDARDIVPPTTLFQHTQWWRGLAAHGESWKRARTVCFLQHNTP